MDDFSLSSPLALGIVLDLSQQREASGRKYIDFIVRTLAHSLSDSNDHVVYVAYEKNKEMPKTAGESIAALNQYADPLDFFVGKEFRRAVNVIGGADYHYRKKVVLFTDRYKAKLNPHYWSGFVDNRGKHYGIDVEVCGIGGFFDDKSLKKLVEDHDGKFIHVLNGQELKTYIQGVLE